MSTTWTSTIRVSAPDGAATYTLTLSIPAPYGVSSQGYYETPHVVEPHKPTNLSMRATCSHEGYNCRRDASYVCGPSTASSCRRCRARASRTASSRLGAHTVNVTRTDSERTLHAVVSVFSRCAPERARPRRGARRGADAAPRAAAPPPALPLRSLSKGTCAPARLDERGRPRALLPRRCTRCGRRRIVLRAAASGSGRATRASSTLSACRRRRRAARAATTSRARRPRARRRTTWASPALRAGAAGRRR